MRKLRKDHKEKDAKITLLSREFFFLIFFMRHQKKMETKIMWPIMSSTQTDNIADILEKFIFAYIFSFEKQK